MRTSQCYGLGFAGSLRGPSCALEKQHRKESWLRLLPAPQGSGELQVNPDFTGHLPTVSTYTLLPNVPWVRCCSANGAGPGWVIKKHQRISPSCSHKCSNGCCYPKAASLVPAATGLSLSEGLLVPERGRGTGSSTRRSPCSACCRGGGAGSPPESV